MILANYSPLRAEVEVYYEQDKASRTIQLMTCNRCGALILIDPAEPPTTQTFHDRWHAKLESKSDR